jgi:hypothetical protein
MLDSTPAHLHIAAARRRPSSEGASATRHSSNSSMIEDALGVYDDLDDEKACD